MDVRMPTYVTKFSNILQFNKKDLKCDFTEGWKLNKLCRLASPYYSDSDMRDVDNPSTRNTSHLQGFAVLRSVVLLLLSLYWKNLSKLLDVCRFIILLLQSLFLI